MNRVAQDYWAEVYRGDSVDEGRRTKRRRRLVLVRTTAGRVRTRRR